MLRLDHKAGLSTGDGRQLPRLAREPCPPAPPFPCLPHEPRTEEPPVLHRQALDLAPAQQRGTRGRGMSGLPILNQLATLACSQLVHQGRIHGRQDHPHRPQVVPGRSPARPHHVRGPSGRPAAYLHANAADGIRVDIRVGSRALSSLGNHHDRGCSVTGVKPAAGESPLELGPPTERSNASNTNPLSFLLRLLLGTIGGEHFPPVVLMMTRKSPSEARPSRCATPALQASGTSWSPSTCGSRTRSGPRTFRAFNCRCAEARLPACGVVQHMTTRSGWRSPLSVYVRVTDDLSALTNSMASRRLATVASRRRGPWRCRWQQLLPRAAASCTPR